MELSKLIYCTKGNFCAMAASHISASHLDSSSCGLWQSLQIISIPFPLLKIEIKKEILKTKPHTVQWFFFSLLMVIFCPNIVYVDEREEHTGTYILISVLSPSPSPLVCCSLIWAQVTWLLNNGPSCSEGLQSIAMMSVASQLPL